MNAAPDVAREDLPVVRVAADDEIDAVVLHRVKLNRLMLQEDDGVIGISIFEQRDQIHPLFHTVAGSFLIAPSGEDKMIETADASRLVGQEFPAAVLQELRHCRVAQSVFRISVGKAAEQRLVDVVVAVYNIRSVGGLDTAQDFSIPGRVIDCSESARDDISGDQNQIRLLRVDPLDHVLIKRDG